MCIFVDLGDITFTFVEDVVQKQETRKRKASASSIVVGKRSRADTASHFELQQQRPSLIAGLRPSLSDQATAFYFHAHHSSPLDLIEPAQEHESLLPTAFRKTDSQSALHSALLARSYAVCGRVRRDARMTSASMALYFGAISKIKEALLDPVDAFSDDVLLTTMVLSSYDNTLSTYTGDLGMAPSFQLSRRMLQSFSHHDGATALLRLRRSNPAQPADLNLDKLVRRQVLRSALLRRRGIPEFLEYGEIFGESGVLLGLDRHMAQLIKIQRYAGMLRPHYEATQIHGGSLNRELLSMLLIELQRLDQDMVSWTRKLSPEWSCTFLQASKVNEEPGSTIHSYKSVGHAAIWNRHRAVRIIGKQVSIELLRLAEHFCGEKCEVPIQFLDHGLRELINDICTSSLLIDISCNTILSELRLCVAGSCSAKVLFR